MIGQRSHPGKTLRDPAFEVDRIRLLPALPGAAWRDDIV
jgi:hypothetical protein